MIHGQTLEQAEKSSRMDEPVHRCGFCDRLFTQETLGKMEREVFPCPCGVQTEQLEKWMEYDHPELQYRDETTTTWDEVVELVADSGFWRCTQCGFTAQEEDWEHRYFGEIQISECPECEAVEDFEVLRIKRD